MIELVCSLLSTWIPSLPATDGVRVTSAFASGARDGLPEVLIDATQGAALWLRGETYKAGFDGGGAQFVPFLGSRAPRNFPLAFALREVSLGGDALPLARAAEPLLDGTTVAFDRGSVIELYRAGPASLEQLFRFDVPPRGADLVLRIACETELEPVADAGGIRFQGEHGGARYGAAIAFDARGRTADVPVEWVDGAIELRVGAEFLSAAAGPVTIDPLITTLAIDTSPVDDRRPDVAYDASLDVYAVCWERWFSASDRDVHGALLDGAGTRVREFLIDASPISLREPRIAGIDALDRFLVATIRVGVNPPAEGRLLDLASGAFTIGPPVTLESGFCETIDLGGDAGTTPPYRFCLAVGWDFGGCRAAVYILVDEDGEPTDRIDSFGDCDDNYAVPRVSKTARGTSSGPRGWAFAFEYIDITHPEDVLAVRVDADGSWSDLVTLASGPFYRTEATSSFLDADSGELTYLAVWRTELTAGANQLFGRVVRGTSLGPVKPLGLGDPSIEYVEADADSDGSNFVVTYTIRRAPGVDEAVLVETYAVEGLELVLTERTELSLGGVQRESALTATRSGGGAAQRFLAVWEDRSGAEGDIVGALYDTPGPGARYCTGAPNSVGPGASIHASGSLSIALDEFTLAASGCPPGVPAMFFLGLNQIDLPFGDGFRCIGGATARITPTLTIGGSGEVALLLDFDRGYGALVQPGAPGVNYQLFYRDLAGGPAGFNLSDALHVEHTP